MIKERLKGLLALVLAGAAVLTTPMAVSAAEGEFSTSLDWGGYVYRRSDSIADKVYKQDSASIADSIYPDPEDLAKEAGIDTNFYDVNGYTIGWGSYHSDYNTGNGSVQAIEFPYNGQGFTHDDHSMNDTITNEKIERIGNDPGNAKKILVLNDEAKIFTIDYYDVFGNKTENGFVFSDGKQDLVKQDQSKEELFGTDGENKKYTLVYNDQGINFDIQLSSDEHPSAWDELTAKWRNNYNGKTFDQAKLSLHRKANFSLNDSYNDVTPGQIKDIQNRLGESDLWLVKYGYKAEYITGDKLADFLDKYNDTSHLIIYDSSKIYLTDETMDQTRVVAIKEINEIPYDLNNAVSKRDHYELEWNLWRSAISGGGDQSTGIDELSSGRRDALKLKDLNDVVRTGGYGATIQYKYVPKIYSVNVSGQTSKLDISIENKDFPAGGGEYLFTYDGSSTVVSDKDELWAAIAAVSANYDSSLSNLVKIQPITSAELTVKVPVSGGTPADASVNSTLYEVTKTTWSPADTVFRANRAYTVTATLKPVATVKFTDDATAAVNGNNASATLNRDGTLTVSYTFPVTDKDTITSAKITVTAPEEGKTPENNAELPADADYTSKSVSWNTDKAFTTGTKYTVTVVLAPGADHKFSANAAATINGNNASAKLNADGTLTVSYTFDKLDADPWKDVDNELKKESPIIKVPGGRPIPPEVIDKIRKSDKKVELDYGDYSWIIDNDFKPGFVPTPIDLRINKKAQKDWATVVNNVTGHRYKMQIEIADHGDFGFTAYLVLDLSEGMNGAPSGDYYANLYYVNGSKLEWSSYSELREENGIWTASLKFTHASDWLITIDNEINPGSKDDSSNTSGSTSKPSEIKLARTTKSEGWSNITKEISSAASGSTIEVTLNDETTMPEQALQAAIDKQVKLIMDAGFGRVWTVDGAKAVSGKYIDLSISGVNVGIPEAAYKDILCSDSRQLKLNARMLNFTAQLSAFIGYDNIGQNAALYSYNEETGKLVFQDISVVDKLGNVIFDIKCGGRYFIALGSEVKAPYYLCGDVNGDGVVNAIDAAAILKNAVYGYPLDKRCGDTNADGEVNAHDALPILHYVVGDIKTLPAPDADNG